MSLHPAAVVVHVGNVVADRDPLFAATVETLGRDDARRLWSLRRRADQQRFLTGRAMIAGLMRGRGLAPPDYEIARPVVAAGDSKPFLRAGDGTHLPHISLSHSGDLVLLAECDSAEVGVDVEAVECLETMSDAAREVFLDATELRELAAIPRTERPSALTTTFTRKEAVLKAIGFGFAVDPRQLRLSRADAAPHVLRFDAAEAQASVLFDVDLAAFEGGAGYRAAVAVCASHATVRIERWHAAPTRA